MPGSPYSDLHALHPQGIVFRATVMHLHPWLWVLVIMYIIALADRVVWPCSVKDEAVIPFSPHSGMARNSDAVDAVVAISIARLRALSAQHHGSHHDACAHLEEGMTAGRQAVAADNQPGIQWLMRDLVMNFKLAQSDLYCCMVRPSLKLF